jgi:hypothetical protein
MINMRWMLAGLALFVSGCAIKPQSLNDCHIRRYELAVNDPGSSTQLALARRAPSGTLAYEIQTTLADRAERASTPDSQAMLFMSGGGQHGAFGAGFLRGWQRQRGSLPPFAVVTGISTGSILATFAFIGDSEAAVRGYTIESERQLLTPYLKKSEGKIGAQTGITLLRKGAIANLAPLRIRLSAAITDDMLTAVARGASDHRKLYVGAVDIDSGEAVAFDLTELASRWSVQTEAAQKARLRGCYIEAIIASSSAPIAAPPVFIDNRMYVDGGARFGVFSQEIGGVVADRMQEDLRTDGFVARRSARPTAYVIINGTQKISALCPTDQCISDPPQNSLPASTHRTWNFLDLALRSQDILANQIYRFSAEKIASDSNGERHFRLAKIEDDMLDFEWAPPGSGTIAHNCRYWRDDDGTKLKPVQFYPHYMRCLIAYGEAKAQSAGW